MGYCCAIIPADSADGVVRAAEVVRAMRSEPKGTPPQVIRDLISELMDHETREFSLERPPDGRGAVVAIQHPESGPLEMMLSMTMDCGLSLYDIEFERLYDPRGRIEVNIFLGGQVRLPYLTRELLRDLVLRPGWPDPHAPFVTIDRADEDYIQAWRAADGSYQLEYRAGGPESHFVLHTREVELVTEVMWAWTTQDPGWRAVDWSFMEWEAGASA